MATLGNLVDSKKINVNYGVLLKFGCFGTFQIINAIRQGGPRQGGGGINGVWNNY